MASPPIIISFNHDPQGSGIIKVSAYSIQLMRKCLRFVTLSIFVGIVVQPSLCRATTSKDFVAGKLITLNDNAAWSWFMDERVIVDKGKLIVGSARAVGKYNTHQSDPNWGNIEVSVYDITTGEVGRIILHRHLEQDDHDSPAFLVLPDGRYLAVYSKHGVERRVYYRVSEPGNPLTWTEKKVFVTPGKDSRPFSGDNVTYSNLFRMPNGRIYNFHRGFSHYPNYIYSDDNGQTWTYGGCLLKGRDGYSPYLKYAYDNKGTIHFIVTEDHPREYDNSIYHGFLRDEQIHLSDGKPVAKLSRTTEPSIAAWDLTRVFPGDVDNVAWTLDIELDGQGRPYIAFSVQKDGRGLPRGKGGMDLRYYYGRWDGSQWHVHEMAYAGTRLYPGEDDYPGLVALNPNDPNTVYISTDADPATGEPLISAADGRRHYELIQGTTIDGGKTWRWTPITANSKVDNIRPIVPKWGDSRTIIVWMRGSYKSNRGEWDTAAVAVVLPPPDNN
jgi:hypothetical protein